MSLKKLADFIRDDIEPNRDGKRPDARTIRKLPWVFKEGNTWWADMDMYRAYMTNRRRGSNRLNQLLNDGEVAGLVSSG